MFPVKESELLFRKNQEQIISTKYSKPNDG